MTPGVGALLGEDSRANNYMQVTVIYKVIITNLKK